MTTNLKPLQVDELMSAIVDEAMNQNAGLALVKANKHFPEMTKEQRAIICDRLNEAMLSARRTMYYVLNTQLR